MLNYIKENCGLPPLEKPLYDEDSNTWDLYFEEKLGDNPYNLEGDLICIPFEDKYEADCTFINAVEWHKESQVPVS